MNWYNNLEEYKFMELLEISSNIQKYRFEYSSKLFNNCHKNLYNKQVSLYIINITYSYKHKHEFREKNYLKA